MALCSFGHALDHLFYVVERCLGAWWGIAWGPPPDSKKVKKNQEGKRSKKDKKDEGKKDTKTIKKSKKGKKGESKDSNDTEGTGKTQTETTAVISVPVEEMEIDDRWADMADGARAPTLQAPATNPPATVAVAEVPSVEPGVTAEVIALGAEDSILKLGMHLTVVDFPFFDHLNGQTAVICGGPTPTSGWNWTCIFVYWHSRWTRDRLASGVPTAYPGGLCTA